MGTERRRIYTDPSLSFHQSLCSGQPSMGPRGPPVTTKHRRTLKLQAVRTIGMETLVEVSRKPWEGNTTQAQRSRC